MSVRIVGKTARILILLAALCLIPFPARAQNVTTVSATIVDPSGLPYSNASVQAQLIPTGITPTINGQAVSGFTRASADVTGTFSMNLASNAVLSPGGTQWQFTVNEAPGIAPPAGTGPQQCAVVAITISGASQNVSATINAGCPKLSNSSAPSLPGISGPPTRGLMARYDIPTTDNPAALTDSSGNGNNGTGTVGTAPTIISGSGGLACLAGASILPASLNSALTIAVYETVGSSLTGGTYFAAVAGNGNSTTSGAIQLTHTNTQNDVGFGDGTSVNQNTTQINANGGQSSFTYQGFLGTHSELLSMDTLDHVYLDGIEDTYHTQGASAGHQTVGQYQVCGAAPGSGFGASTYATNNVKIYHVYFYSVILTTQERNQLVNWLNTLGTLQGVPVSNPNPTAPALNLFTNGDSIMNGWTGTYTPYPSVWTLYRAYTTVDRGFSAVAAGNLTGTLNAINGQYYNPLGADNLQFMDLGTNDLSTLSLSAAQSFQNISTLINDWNARGGRSIVATMVSRQGTGGTDAKMQGLNTVIVQNWRTTRAVVLADFGNNASLGATNACLSTVYFAGDCIHPNQNGHYNNLLPIAQRSVNRASGNLDWSTAATYTAGAPTATATTALSETGNTVTVTFGATPANCQVGNMIVIAGVTAAGYNSTPTNGAGENGWMILTRSATQVTYWNGVTGLSAATVQGTGQCPLMQDQDVYAVLGGSSAAQNDIEESCAGYSGQYLYRMITDTNAWTITPFNSAETINGGATFTTPVASATNHPVVQLKAIPGAIGTGGCSWQASIQ